MLLNSRRTDPIKVTILFLYQQLLLFRGFLFCKQYNPCKRRRYEELRRV